MPVDTPPPAMTRTLRALAWLLRYPDDTVRAALPDLVAALRSEAALPAARLAEIGTLAAQLGAARPLRAEADYVELFDRGRRTALHLFEHVYGDSRDRGPAMVDLLQTYERAGVHLAAGELPDYLPVVLEFASTQPPPEARAFLRETAHLVRAVMSALAERGSAYASVLGAVLDLAGEATDAVPLAAEPALDEAWEEPPVFGGCASAGQARPNESSPVHIVRRSRPARSARAA